MAIVKKFSEFNKNESMKKFSGSKSDTKLRSGNDTLQRAPVSASSDYEDSVNANILSNPEGATKNSDKSKEREYKTTKSQQNKVKDDNLYPKDLEKNDRGIVSFKENKKVDIYGKVAKFPQNTLASKAFNYMNNLKDPKLSKKSIWYLMVEKQDNELQLVKYIQNEGVNLTKFVIDLKNYYTSHFAKSSKLVEAISAITVGGDKDGNISSIKNIPNINIGGKKLIHKITEDLISLLS